MYENDWVSWEKVSTQTVDWVLKMWENLKKFY